MVLRLLDEWVLTALGGEEFDSKHSFFSALGLPLTLAPGQSWAHSYDYDDVTGLKGRFEGKAIYFGNDMDLTVAFNDTNDLQLKLEFRKTRNGHWHYWGVWGERMADLNAIDKETFSRESRADLYQRIRARFGQYGVAVKNEQVAWGRPGVMDRLENVVNNLF